MSLLEKTGYSYSGIADIIHNGGDTKALLQEIYTKHKEAVRQVEELQKQLGRAEKVLSLCFTSFKHAHKALKLGDKPLTFEINEGKGLVVFEVDDEGDIDYKTIELTKLP